MKIVGGAVSMAAQHMARSDFVQSESLRTAASGRSGSGPSAQTATITARLRDSLQISDQARSLAAQGSQSAGLDVSEEEAWARLAPDDRTRILILERLLGIKIKLSTFRSDKASLEDQADRAGPAGTRAGSAVRYERSATYTEQESLRFQAQGVVNTADGKQIEFNLELQLSREFTATQQIRFQAGDQRLLDPLVINYSGPGADLSGGTYRFDLNMDGKPDAMPFLSPGSGYLAIDKNGNGKVDDGSELFGPASGNGFGELSAQDADKNGWIDAADPVFQKLRIWVKGAGGEDRLISLADAGVGAILVSGVQAAFTHKDGAGEAVAQTQRLGVFLRENGQAGTVQQLDVVV